MSALEGRAKPILTSMMSGAPSVFDVDQLSTLAAWAFKTAAMFQYNDHPTRAVDRAEMIALKRTMTPPANAEVRIFWSAERTNSMRLRNAGAGTELNTPDGPRIVHPKSSVTVMIADRLGLHVTFTSMDSALRVPDYPNVSHIWPDPEPISWPPRALSDNEVGEILKFIPGALL
jgi:hypothetical protein